MANRTGAGGAGCGAHGLEQREKRYDHEGERPTCKSIAEHMRLVQAADLAYPIIICPQGRVMDGMHRVVKAWLEGRSTVLAYYLPVLPEPDYVGVDPHVLPHDDTRAYV